jgi:hypothetical protein
MPPEEIDYIQESWEVTGGPRYPNYPDNPHYFYVWEPAHQGNTDVAKRLVTISFYSCAIFVIFILNSIFCRTDIQRS